MSDEILWFYGFIALGKDCVGNCITYWMDFDEKKCKTMVSLDMTEEYLNEDCIRREDEYIGRDESLMYIDDDSPDSELYRQNSLTGVTCRKKCVVRLDNARYTIGNVT